MASTIATEDAALVAQEAFAPIKYGEGARIGLVGDTRCGKTRAAKELIAEFMRRSPGPVLIADDKEAQPQFEGQCRRNKADLEANPPDEKIGRVVILRGARFDLETGAVDPEEIADLQFGLAQGRPSIPSLGVYDELDRACDHGQFKRSKNSAIRWVFKQGGSAGCSAIWGTQETQDIPAPIFNQSTLILCFKMLGAPVRLLRERNYLLGGVEETIGRLPGAEVPPDERGAFVVLRRGQEWDGKVWRFRSSGFSNPRDAKLAAGV